MEILEPKIRFSEFQRNWEKSKIKDIVNRYTEPVKVELHTQYRQIGIRSHGKGLFHKNLVSGETLGNKRVFWIKENALIINIVFAWEQAVAKTTEKEIGMIASHRFPMYLPFNNKSNIDFLNYFFLTKKGKFLLESASPGGAGRNKTLGQKEFDNSKIIVPSIQEQTKIANFLLSVDKKLNLLKEKKALLEEYKKGIMQKIFNQELRFKDDNGEDFGEWDNVNLQFISSNYYQGINTAADKTKYYSEGYPILQAKHITSEKISYEDSKFVNQVDYDLYKLKYKPNINEILISNIGTIGKVLLINENVDFLIAWNIFKVTLKPQITNALYITYNLKYISGLGYFDECKTGNATKFVNKSDMLNTPIYLPCLEEQTKIANFLLAIDEKIELVSNQIEDTQEYKKGLLQQMFV